MPYSSLKRKSPAFERSVTPKQKLLDVEAFIDEAQDYAIGKSPPVKSNVVELKYLQQLNEDINHKNKMQPSTFTLSKDAKERIGDLAMQTGISRSRLIRIWLSEDFASEQILKFITSDVV